uniref:Uncharacterized protein n=1 Tax=Arundo donax TaxID=35708 RepID=A0A0A9D4R3_ARUDO
MFLFLLILSSDHIWLTCWMCPFGIVLIMYGLQAR